MITAVGVNLVAFQFRVFLGRGQHRGTALGIDCLGQPMALGLRMPKQLAEHLFDVVVRMVVTIPQDHMIPRYPLRLALPAPLPRRHQRIESHIAIVTPFPHAVVLHGASLPRNPNTIIIGGMLSEGIASKQETWTDHG